MNTVNPQILKAIFNVIMQSMHIIKHLNESIRSLETSISNLENMSDIEIKATLASLNTQLSTESSNLFAQIELLCTAYEQLLQ